MTEININDYIAPNKRIFLSGIGGVSMRALAKLLKSTGANVFGSDRDSSVYTAQLETLGIKVATPQVAENVIGADLIIRTAAISDENPEILAARAANIPVMARADAWGEIMRCYRSAVCIAGTHGKTSTTSMVATFTQASGLDPTVMVGGDLPSIGGTLRIGGSELFIAEACEYKNSFLSFSPTVAVILNIDRDHLDFFSSTDDIIASFTSFAKLVPPGGTIVANGDDANTQKAIAAVERHTITFGHNSNSDVYPENVACQNGFYSADVIYGGKKYCSITLSVPGEHNLQNALAAAAVAITLGVDGSEFSSGLSKYQGVGRRFEYKGEFNGAKIVDDYAHHPSEVTACLKAAHNMNAKRIICVFQPHTYSRTISLLNDFAKALSNCDICLLCDIFAAREVNATGLTSAAISDKMDNGIYVGSLDAAANYIKENARPGDLIFTMGAGDVYKVYDKLSD